MVYDNHTLSFLVLSAVGIYSALLVGITWMTRHLWLITPAIE